MIYAIYEPPSTVHLKVKNKITAADIETISALLEMKFEKAGRLKLYFALEDITSIEPAAWWEDFQFSLSHLHNFEKVVISGDEKWMKWMAKFGRLFTSAEVKYYDFSKNEENLQWRQKEVTKQE